MIDVELSGNVGHCGGRKRSCEPPNMVPYIGFRGEVNDLQT